MSPVWWACQTMERAHPLLAMRAVPLEIVRLPSDAVTPAVQQRRE